MDIFARLDKLEDFIANSKRVPLSSSVMVNEAEFYDLLDDIRATLPNELKQSRHVAKERDRIMAEAQRKEEELLARRRSAPTTWSSRPRSSNRPSSSATT